MRIKVAWENMTKRNNFSLRISITLVISILSALSLTNVVDPITTNNFIIPLVGIVMTLMGIDKYNNNKVLAYFSFGGAAIMFGIGLLTLLSI